MKPDEDNNFWKDVLSYTGDTFGGGSRYTDLKGLVMEAKKKNLIITSNIYENNTLEGYLWEKFFANYKLFAPTPFKPGGAVEEFKISAIDMGTTTELSQGSGSLHNLRLVISDTEGHNQELSSGGLFPPLVKIVDKATEKININTTCSFTYGKNSIGLPMFYAAPFKVITDTVLKKTSGMDNIKVIKGKMGRGEFTLAIVVEDEKNIIIHIASPAGLYFVNGLVKEVSGLTQAKWDEYWNNSTFRELSKRLIKKRQESITTLRQSIALHISNLIKAHRDVFAAERLAKDSGGNVIKQLVNSLSVEAKKEPAIKAIGVTSSGQVFAFLEGLELSYYTDEDGETICYSDYDKESCTVEKTAMGDLSVNLDEHLVNKADGGVLHHPHIYEGENGRVCLGNSDSIYAQLLGDLNIVGAIRVMIALITRATDDYANSSVDSVDDFNGENPKLSKMSLKEIQGFWAMEWIYIKPQKGIK